MTIEHLIRRLRLRHIVAAALFLLLAGPAAMAAAPAARQVLAVRPVAEADFNLHGLNGLPVYAINPGRVRFAGYRNGLGQIVDIDQGNGFSTRYAHLDRLLVHPGQSVALHQEIGLVNDTGWTLWPRLLSNAGFSLPR